MIGYRTAEYQEGPLSRREPCSEARPPAEKLFFHFHEHGPPGARILMGIQDLKGENMLLILQW